jgi:hypothetical protein
MLTHVVLLCGVVPAPTCHLRTQNLINALDANSEQQQQQHMRQRRRRTRQHDTAAAPSRRDVSSGSSSSGSPCCSPRHADKGGAVLDPGVAHDAVIVWPHLTHSSIALRKDTAAAAQG